MGILFTGLSSKILHDNKIDFFDTYIKHFKPAEFRNSLIFLKNDLFIKLDKFRDTVNAPVIISPAKGALLRIGFSTSAHYKGKAADIFVDTDMPFLQLVKIAKETGFTGIGIYPDWKLAGHSNAKGMHLDVRKEKSPGKIATWGALNDPHGNRIYMSMQKVLDYEHV